MEKSVRLWLYMYVIDGLNYSQIARLFGTYRMKVTRAIQGEFKRALKASDYKQLTKGKALAVLTTAWIY